MAQNSKKWQSKVQGDTFKMFCFVRPILKNIHITMQNHILEKLQLQIFANFP